VTGNGAEPGAPGQPAPGEVMPGEVALGEPAPGEVAPWSPPAPDPPVPPARRPVGSWLLPVLGGVWLALTMGPPVAFYVLGAFVGGALRVACQSEGERCHLDGLPVSIAGAVLGGSAIVVLLVLIRVPHRGRQRWLRGGLLAALAVLSAVAEGLLFSAWRT
jgi:hypothetical protein